MMNKDTYIMSMTESFRINKCVFSFRLKTFEEVDAGMSCGSLCPAYVKARSPNLVYYSSLPLQYI